MIKISDSNNHDLNRPTLVCDVSYCQYNMAKWQEGAAGWERPCVCHANVSLSLLSSLPCRSGSN